MKPTRQNKVRQLLRNHPLGLSSFEISEKTGLYVANVRTALRAMPDCYVDRWRPAKRGQFEKIWIAVPVPENCPHLRDKKFRGGFGSPPKSKWQQVERWV